MLVRISGRGDLNTGEDGGRGVWDASFKARKGALFRWPRWPFGCAMSAFVDGGALGRLSRMAYTMQDKHAMSCLFMDEAL
jgi:hypothetical protein